MNNLILVLVVIQIFVASAVHADLGTLFTTEKERKTINEERFKKPVIVEPVKEIKKVKVVEPVKVKYKEVTTEYKISGITIVENGIDSVWINKQRFDHGETFNDIKVIINAKQQSVSLRVKGGKTYRATSGETITISKFVKDLAQK